MWIMNLKRDEWGALSSLFLNQQHDRSYREEGSVDVIFALLFYARISRSLYLQTADRFPLKGTENNSEITPLKDETLSVMLSTRSFLFVNM